MKSTTKSKDILERYNAKVLGIRNYEAEKEDFYVSDFTDQNVFLDFVCEVSDGESDFTPAGIAFVNEYYDLQSVAETARQKGRALPPHGEGKSDEQRIRYFLDYMRVVEPMETALFIAESNWTPGDGGEKPSLESLQEKYLPPK